MNCIKRIATTFLITTLTASSLFATNLLYVGGVAGAAENWGYGFDDYSIFTGYVNEAFDNNVTRSDIVPSDVSSYDALWIETRYKKVDEAKQEYPLTPDELSTLSTFIESGKKVAFISEQTSGGISNVGINITEWNNGITSLVGGDAVAPIQDGPGSTINTTGSHELLEGVTNLFCNGWSRRI